MSGLDDQHSVYATSIMASLPSEEEDQQEEPSPEKQQEGPGSTWKQWRHRQREELEMFIQQRLHGMKTANAPITPRVHDETQESQESESPEDSFLETQQPFEEETDQGDDEQQIQHIPHVDETHQPVNNLLDLDLYAGGVTLDLCEVDKMWKLRVLRRPSTKYYDSLAPKRPQKDAHFSRSTWQYCAEDGPLKIGYGRDAKVLSLEVCPQQMAQTELRQRAERMHEEIKTPRRLRVFFYNKYAESVEALLNKLTKAKKKKAEKGKKDSSVKLILSLQKIPPHCIFPFVPTDWYDRHDQSECCLCIGDISLVTVDIPRHDFHFPFDLPGMVLYLAAVADETLVQEFKMEVDAQWDLRITEQSEEESFVAKLYEERRKLDERKPAAVGEESTKESETVVTAADQQTRAAAASESAVAEVSVATKRREGPTAGWGEENTPPHEGARKETSTPKHANRGCGALEAFPPQTQRPQLHGRAAEGGAQGSPQRTGVQSFFSNPVASPLSPRRKKQCRETVKYEKLVRLESRSLIGIFQWNMLTNLIFIFPSLLQSDLRTVYDTYSALAMQTGSTRPQHCKINVYGAVLSFSPPTRTKRGDWMMNLVLVDDSLPLPESEAASESLVRTVTLLIFAKSKDHLPRVRYAGDVIRLHRVKLERWKDEEQLVGIKQASSFVVVRGDIHDPPATKEPLILATAENEFTMTDDDQKRSLELWHWMQKRLMTHATMKAEHSFRLSDMKHQSSTHTEQYGEDNARGDLTVMVAAIIPVPREQTPGYAPCGFLRVWDGTGFPASDPLPLDTAEAHEAVRNGDPPIEALIKIAGIIRKLQFIRQDPDLRPPNALTGRVANVAIWEPPHWEIVSEILTVGSFVRLRNVQDTVMLNGSFRCLHVYTKSSLTPLPNLTHEVVRLLEEHNSRIARKEQINQQSGILPLDEDESDQAQAGYGAPQPPERAQPQMQTPQSAHQRSESVTSGSRLHDLLSSDGPMDFEGKVRIIGTVPPFNALSVEGRPHIISSIGGACAYRFAVRIQDESTSSSDDSVHSIDAIVDNSVGETLLGMPPDQVLVNRTEALKKLRQILEEQHPWTVKVRSVTLHNAQYFLLESADAEANQMVVRE
jgi:hypothetical protein